MTISAADASSAASAERVARGEVVTVAEDRAKRGRDYSRRGLAAGKVLVDAERFEAAMEPTRPARVGVAVGDERAIIEWDGL